MDLEHEHRVYVIVYSVLYTTLSHNLELNDNVTAKRDINYDPTTPGGLSGNPNTKFRSLLTTLTLEFPPIPTFPRNCFVSNLGKDEHLFQKIVYPEAREYS